MKQKETWFQVSFLLGNHHPGMELLIELNVLPTLGPSSRMTAITTSATSAKMIAYSTSPWPFSLMADNINKFLSKKAF
jgi:hypothetical protein